MVPPVVCRQWRMLKRVRGLLPEPSDIPPDTWGKGVKDPELMFSRNHVTGAGGELSSARPGSQKPDHSLDHRRETEPRSAAVGCRGPQSTSTHFRHHVPFQLRQNLHMNGPSQAPVPTTAVPSLPQVSVSTHSTFAKLGPFLALATHTSVLAAAVASGSGTTDQHDPSCPVSFSCGGL